jgi:hypothetical protein
MEKVPMIYTSKGNLPIADLQERVVWIETDIDTVCNWEYWLGDECVFRKCSNRLKNGAVSLSAIGDLNG